MYRPGDKNVKADFLSRIHAPDEPSSPEPILPPAVLVRAKGPEGKTYVPTSLRATLLGSLHASPGSGHPGSQRTLSLLKLGTGGPVWPGMSPSTFVDAQSAPSPKTPHHLPSRKFVPLPIPRRPRSHVGVSSAYKATNPSVALDRRALRRSSCRPLVPSEEREFGTQLMSNSSRQCGDTRPMQMPAGLPPPSIVLEIRSGSHPGSASLPALPEAESPLYRSLYHREADK